MPVKSQHLKDIDKYVNDVIAGRRVANVFEIAACKRYKDDVKRSRTKAFVYKFDKEKAQRAIKFIELLPHTKGHWAKSVGIERQVRLQGWQKFIIAMIFGWVHKDTGLRRFRVAYICVPRKNGKSLLAAGIGHYMFTADDEYGAEVYCGATTEKQAWEVFKPAKIMAERTPQYCRRYGVQINAKTMETPYDGSKFAPIIGTPGDGASPSCAIVDEYHEHPNDELYDTMLTGMGARQQPLMLVITTAGSDISSPCYQMQKDIEKVLTGVYENDQQFGIIYTIDKGDEWTDPQSLIKANPNYGISVMEDFLQNQLRDAMQSPRKQNTFQRKHLDKWVNAKDAWMNMEWWHRQADASLRREDYAEDEGYKALDLSSKHDITADVDLFVRNIDGVKHFYVFGKYYVPEEAAQEEGKDRYQGWINQGELIATDGNIIDFESIEENIVSTAKASSISQIAYDPWGATQLAQRLQDQHDLLVIEVPQNVKNLSEPMKWVFAMVKAGRLHHDGNQVLAWMMSNVVAKEDANDNIYPRKEVTENKIDGAVALIMAMSRAMLNEDSGGAYDDRGVMVF